MSCCVPNCIFRDKCLKQSRFHFPKDLALRYEWEKALGLNFHPNSRVCRQHFRDVDVNDSWVTGNGNNKYTVCLKRAKLRNGAIPIPVTNGSIISVVNIANTNDKTNNDCGTSCGNAYDDLLSSINNDHCYTAIKPQENKIVHDTGTINYLKRDAPLFNTELTSPAIPKRLKVLYLL